MTSATRLGRLLIEAKRRRVFRVAAAYAIVASAIIALANDTFPSLGLPPWAITLVIVISIAGFVLALALAWAFDVTTEGVVRTESAAAYEVVAESAKPINHSTATGVLTAPVVPTENRIAVLPFANISPNPDDEYFADGMTEELISTLSRIAGLDVIARTSVMSYKRQPKSVAEIGRELAVRSVLEGSVRRAENRLRITVQLIDAQTQGHLWTQNYDRELRDVFRIQADISESVARCLSARLLRSDEHYRAVTSTADLAAYDLYLLGRYHWNRCTDEGIRTAIGYFERAIERDSAFAAAYSGLADAYTLAAVGYVASPPADAMARAAEAARKALHLVDALPDAHASLGIIAQVHEWNWPAAERELLRALEINPSHEFANRWYGWHLLGTRQFQAAVSAFQRAWELNPLSPVAVTERGWPHGYLSEHQLAKNWYLKALDLDPNFALAHYNLGMTHERLGAYDEAIEAYERAEELSGSAAFVIAGLASAWAHKGRHDRAQALLDSLRQRARAGAKVALYVAVAEEAVGQAEAAMTSLEQAFRDREVVAFMAGTEWLPFESLRSELRFQDLVARLNLPYR